MSNTVISVENVSKFYRLGLIGGGTLKDDLIRKWAKFRGKPDPLQIIGQEDTSNREGEFIWALRDINLEVKQGEIMGIIGKNGAGKSTLLKILTKITAPTKGRIKMKGRVGSLLEVGTGFHPELTGRENIYLNGAILGMTKPEISGKLDEIIAFSGIELYIDTPIKRYSSGMNVRLAFAVAAHLEPEILLIDEVLAVGDVEFQRKCLGKMQDIAGEGRTILFVSHNMTAINRLCSRAAFLYKGELELEGDTNTVVNQYLNKATENAQEGGSISFEDNFDKAVQILGMSLIKSDRTSVTTVEYHESILLKIRFVVRESKKDYYTVMAVNDIQGNMIFFSSDEDMEASIRLSTLKQGEYTYFIPFPNNLLRPGRYYIHISFNNHITGSVDQKSNYLAFDVVDNKSYRALHSSYRPASVAPEVQWTLSA